MFAADAAKCQVTLALIIVEFVHALRRYLLNTGFVFVDTVTLAAVRQSRV